MSRFLEKLEKFRYRHEEEHRPLLGEAEEEDDPSISSNCKRRKCSAETLSGASKNLKSDGTSSGFVKKRCIRPLRNLIKRKSRSPVWAFFTKIDQRLAKCDICCAMVQRSGGTSNLFEHLYRNHKKEYSITQAKTSVTPGKYDEMTPKQPLQNSAMVQPEPVTKENESVITCVQELENNVSDIPKISSRLSIKTKFVNYFKSLELCYDRNDPRKKRLDKFLAVMIARDFQPLDIVNDGGFKQFCLEMDPRYKLPCRKTLMTEILPELYTNIHLLIESFLKNASSISLTTDTWTSRTNQHYIGVTAHFIDVNFNLRSVILTVRAMNGYSSDDFKDEIESIVVELAAQTRSPNGESATCSYLM